MRVCLLSICEIFDVGLLVLGVGFSGSVLAEDVNDSKPRLCRGNYHSEQAAKEQLAKFAKSYSSPEQWKARAQRNRKGILRGAGLDPMPKKYPLNPIIHSKREH